MAHSAYMTAEPKSQAMSPQPETMARDARDGTEEGAYAGGALPPLFL